MGNDSYQQFYLKSFSGENNKLDDNELDLTKAVQAQNCDFESVPGAVVKRPPLGYYNTTSMGTGQVLGAFRFYLSSGTKKLLAVHGSSIYVGDDTTGAMTAIKTGLTSGKRASFVVYKDLCYISNGYENVFVYDGVTDVVWEMGACKATLTSGGSNLDSTGAYYYAVTFDTDAVITGALSNTVTTSASYRKVTLSNIPLGPVGTANRKIFRTEGGGSTLKLLTTISDNTTTTYVDDVADASLGATMGAVTDDMPKGNKLKIHRERLFIAGDPNEPNKIYYSNPYLPHFIQQTAELDYMEIAPDDGDQIMDIPIVNSIMFCVKRNTIRRLHITTPVSGASPTQWYADDVQVYDGSVSAWAVIETPYGIIYPNSNHWRVFNGSSSQDIFDEFDSNRILPAQLSEIVAFYEDGMFYAAYTSADGGNMYNDKLMLYNVRRKAMSIDPIAVNCFTALKGGDEAGDVYFGNAVNGYLLIFSDAIYWQIYKTKTQLNEAACTNVVVLGEEAEPYLEIGRTETIDELTGTIDDLAGTIDMGTLSGTITFDSLELNAGSFVEFEWNELLNSTDDNINIYTRAGATQSACEAASWDGPISNPTGSAITTTGNVWFQFKINMIAGDYISPRVYTADNFTVKFSYQKGGNTAETAVEFIWRMGFRNFNAPIIDKIFKKIATEHSVDGEFTINWETENSNGSFVISNATNRIQWDSYFPDTAYGKKMDIEIYKNDLLDLTVNEIMGVYSPRPIII
jgi:hypothetical protein